MEPANFTAEEEMKQESIGKQVRKRLTYANVMVTILAFIVLGGGSALAASQLGKNSVGPRQLKSKSVTTGKIANNAVNSAKVANGSLTGADINLNALGTVPAATTATSAGNANTVGGHVASCPADTTLIRGVCFDSSSNPEAPNLVAAAERCAVKGGYLPTPLELYSAKGVVNLGTGVGTSKQFTDDIYSAVGQGKYSTVTIDGTGAIAEQEISQPAQYYCVYPLVR
jgi:hypothetical protein